MKNKKLGIRIIIFITTLVLTTSHISMADEITNYRLHINKINQEACNLHIRCSFSLNFQEADSVSMNFGGGQEFSIDNLRIDDKEFEYEYNLKSKNIVFHKREAQTVQVKMDYSYTNLSAFSYMEKETLNFGKLVSENTTIRMFRTHIWSYYEC